MLLEANDEWQLQHRYMQTEAMAELASPTSDAAPTQIATSATFNFYHVDGRAPRIKAWQHPTYPPDLTLHNGKSSIRKCEFPEWGNGMLRIRGECGRHNPKKFNKKYLVSSRGLYLDDVEGTTIPRDWNQTMADYIKSSHQTMPRFTVVMPCYRAADTIGVAIASVMAQTEANFELIVVDDGSPDRTVEAALIAIGDDARCRVICQANAGPAAARNAGGVTGNGLYLAFLDADDRWTPGALAAHDAHFNARPELGVSFGRTRFYDHALAIPGRCSAHIANVQLGQVLAENPVCTTSNIVVRLDLFLALGGFDSSLTHAEDQEFVMRVLATTRWKVGGINAELVHYRTSISGLSADLVQMERGWTMMIDRARLYADPVHFNAAEAHARALYGRYLARRALRTGDRPLIAFAYLWRAFWSAPLALLGQETKRTMLTAAGVLAALTLPRRLVAPLIAR